MNNIVKRNFFMILITLIVFIIFIGMLLINNITKNEVEDKDSTRFKEEYESLNKQKNSNDKEYRSISIPTDNPFIYKDASDIVDMIENKETFIVYFGFNSCPWCRSVLPTLIEVAKDLKIDEIYYVDVKDIRDIMSINKKGELETTKEGTDSYYELLDLLDNVLEDYTLNDTDGKKVSTKEKRIYAPNIVTIVKGKAKALESGISDKQKDAYMELTDEIKKDTYNKFKKILKDMKK